MGAEENTRISSENGAGPALLRPVWDDKSSSHTLGLKGTGAGGGIRRRDGSDPVLTPPFAFGARGEERSLRLTRRFSSLSSSIQLRNRPERRI